METMTSENHLALRLIIFGGEALELQSLKPWIKRHGDKRRQLVNIYGIVDRNWSEAPRLERRGILKGKEGDCIPLAPAPHSSPP